jgi:hypothetical protein
MTTKLKRERKEWLKKALYWYRRKDAGKFHYAEYKVESIDKLLKKGRK